MTRKHVYLTGFMGAGKSKIGPLLAGQLGREFLDSDHLIEEQAGKSIHDIFQKDGEERFRSLESGILKQLAARRDASVIALGGGALNREENRERVRQTGITVYIKSSPRSILERVKHSRKRPLLKIEPGEDFENRLLARIELLLSEREGIYSQADIIINRDDLSLDEIVKVLSERLMRASGAEQDETMMRIDVDLGKDSYPVLVGRTIMQRVGDLLETHGRRGQLALISSEHIFALYGDALTGSLHGHGDLLKIMVPDGEHAKSLSQVESIYTQLLTERFERGSVIIALGGGVIGDLAGFVAATYLRGVSLVQVPTTLLAQVDSSIGGKVGVNHPLGKNLIGAFKHPLFVLSDTAVLKTLPPEEIRCGLGEVIKYGFIRDDGLFSYLERNLDAGLNGDPDVLLELVRRSAAIKADVVMRDEREQNLRMILNFGHTFGHALEAELQFSGIRHGEAVILGMQCALEYMRLVHGMDKSFYQRGIELLKRVPVSYRTSDIHPHRLVQRMALDKKVKDKQIRLVLVEEPGKYRIEPVNDNAALLKAWDILNK